MRDLISSFGKGLTSVFFAAVVIWALMLIILPQLTMLEKALTKPLRQLDSSIAGGLERDAADCANILGQYVEPTEGAVSTGGLAVPSASGMAVPSMSGMASPTLNETAQRPYILQCDRSTTRRQMVRDKGMAAFLDHG